MKKCKQGHELTPENSCGVKRIRCKTCMNESSRKSYQRGKLLDKIESFNEAIPEIQKMFDSHVIKLESGHWHWTKNKPVRHHKSRSEILTTGINNILYNVLDVSYSLHHGKMIKGFCYNICEYPHCVNPEHIIHSPRWFIRTQRTTCSKGHDLTNPDNYVEYRVKDSVNLYKKCKICRKERESKLEQQTL